MVPLGQCTLDLSSNLYSVPACLALPVGREHTLKSLVNFWISLVYSARRSPNRAPHMATTLRHTSSSSTDSTLYKIQQLVPSATCDPKMVSKTLGRTFWQLPTQSDLLSQMDGEIWHPHSVSMGLAVWTKSLSEAYTPAVQETLLNSGVPTTQAM